jgi:hypothetical protein
MPPFVPISRRDLIAALRAAGFDGPYSLFRWKTPIYDT